MKKYPHITVIVLNFNGFEDTKNLCLPSLLKTSYKNFSIIVVDNGSSINEAKLLALQFKSKKITFVRNSRNLGFTGGNNNIIKTIKSKYTVFLNNDTMAKAQWLTELVKEMESSIKIAACQPKVLLYDQKNKFDYAGGGGGFIDKYGYPFTRGRVFSTSEIDKGQYDSKANLFWASGVAMIVRTNIFKKIGMFDNSFFLYMEEIDVCWRLLQKGYLIRSVPSSIIYHKVAASAKKNMFRKRYYEHRNNLMMVVKNYSKHDLITLFPKRLIFEFICSLYYLFIDFTSFRALIMAHIDFWKIFPRLITRRNKNTSSITSFKQIVYDGSIVLDYFVFKKKAYIHIGNDNSQIIKERNNITKIFQIIKNKLRFRGERSNSASGNLIPTFYQHKAVYTYCLQFISRKNVADIGCGTGYGSNILAQKAKRVIGIDNDYKTIQTAKKTFKNSNLDFICRDINKTNAFLGRNHVVISLQCIEHLKNPHIYLKNILESLNSNDICILSTPNRETQGYNENPYHFKEYTKEELELLLKKYFKRTTILGLFGDDIIIKYENQRKERIMKMMNFDFLKIRRLLPRIFLIFLFEICIPMIRKSLKKENGNAMNITEKNYKVSPFKKNAIDLIAVCYK